MDKYNAVLFLTYIFIKFKQGKCKPGYYCPDKIVAKFWVCFLPTFAKFQFYSWTLTMITSDPTAGETFFILVNIWLDEALRRHMGRVHRRVKK